MSGLRPSTLAQMQQTQQVSRWCWAASISMVLRRYGLTIPQDQIIRTEFGTAVNAGLPGEDILGLLNRPWRDADGQAVAISAGQLPTWRRNLGLAAPEVIDDLASDKPLLVGLPHHTVVLVQVVYERSPDLGMRLLRAVALTRSWRRGCAPFRSTRAACSSWRGSTCEPCRVAAVFDLAQEESVRTLACP